MLITGPADGELFSRGWLPMVAAIVRGREIMAGVSR
jgi:hypothetical protein